MYWIVNGSKKQFIGIMEPQVPIETKQPFFQFDNEEEWKAKIEELGLQNLEPII